MFRTLRPGWSFFCFVYKYHHTTSQLRLAQLSSAPQRYLSRAAPCWCCPVPRCVLCLLFRTCKVIFDEVSCSITGVYHNRFVRTTLLNKTIALPAQVSYSSAARSAVPCRAVPCPAVPCCAVLSFEHSTRCHAKYQVPGIGMYVCTRLLAFFTGCPPSRSSFFYFANFPRIADQKVTSPTSTQQYSTGQSAQHKYLLALSNR